MTARGTRGFFSAQFFPTCVGRIRRAAIATLSYGGAYYSYVRFHRSPGHKKMIAREYSMVTRTIILVFCIALYLGSAHAGTWYVTIGGTGDVPTIQAAIDSAAAGDTILVGPGRYTWSNQGCGNEKGFIRVMDRKRVVLLSEGGAELTILDAEYMNRTIYVQGMNHIIVEGFTITGGEAPYFGDYVGGGYFNHISGDTIRHCRFFANRARHGGGISSCGNGYVTVVEDCSFEQNEADRYGGAVLYECNVVSSIIRDCTFVGNTAGDRGGAVALYFCPLTMERCVFKENTAVERGGAVSASNEGDAILGNCTLAKNEAPSGAAISIIGLSSLDLDRTIVYRSHGPWLELEEGLTAIVGCCDIFGNAGGDLLPGGVNDTGGNIFLDPLFCGPAGPDEFHVHADSPCLPRNHPSTLLCQLIGARPPGCDGVSTERTSWGGIKKNR